MSTIKLAVVRHENFPFLTLKPVIEGTLSTQEVIELSGDDFADYEESARKFSAWQHRIGEAEAVTA